MISVRLYQGDRDRASIVLDTLMSTVPRVGETFTIRSIDFGELRYEVLEVDYLIDEKRTTSPTEELTGVQIMVKAIP